VADDLDRACAQVGRFLYHFANLENQIDQAFSKLFDLSLNSANMITGSVDFYKRFNFVLTATLNQIKDAKGQERVKKILNKVSKHNDYRQVVAHSRFESVGDGVKFTRVIARQGTVRIPDETWSKKDFEDKYEVMQKLVKQLKEEVVERVRPMKNYVAMPANTGTISLMGSPAALLASLDD
jgi:hypothetical protein